MKIMRPLAAFLFLAAASAFPQSRDDVRIYFPPVVGSAEQAEFFHKNFSMETAAAGYAVTENENEADYSMKLTVKPNMIVFDDGTEEPAPPDEDQFILLINLMRNSDGVEIVSLSFGFSEMDEMYKHNLSLIYQAMANVPMTKALGGETPSDKTPASEAASAVPAPAEDDMWRNKWVYVRASLNFPISYYQAKSDGLYNGAGIYDPASLVPNSDPPEYNRYSRLEHKILPMPGATIGVEVQFMDWMSAELIFDAKFQDPVGYAFIPGLGLQIKFPLKPSGHFMLEPYAAVAASINTADHSVSYPLIAAGAGAQLGVKGVNMGAFFFDINFLYSIGDAQTNNPDEVMTQPEVLHWNHFVIGLGLGYKIGFINRPKKQAPKVNEPRKIPETREIQEANENQEINE